MLRAIWFLVILAALAAAALWLAVVAFGAAISYRLWVFLRGVPASIGRVRQEGRRRRGYLALTRGMVAVAAGDAVEARRQGGRADGLLSDPSLTMLLSAQAAQLNGDETAAEKFFTAMLERPEMEFLGLRGLLLQATRRGDTTEALKWARRAYAVKPKSQWLGSTLFDLQISQGLWTEAGSTLANAIKHKAVSPVDARRRQVALAHLISMQSAASNDPAGALKKAKQAFDGKPGFIPGTVHYAGLLATAGKSRKAMTVLEGGWRAHPHPDLAAAYWLAAGADDAMAKMKAAQKLSRGNPDHEESHLMLAATALDAELWGDARKNLHKLIDAPGSSVKGLVTVAVCRMMAELEERENNDLAAAREWLFRAGNAEPDSMWVCRECGNATREWTPLCGRCQGFDDFQWSRPLNVPGISAVAKMEIEGPDVPALLVESSPPALRKPDKESPQDIDEKSAGH